MRASGRAFGRLRGYRIKGKRKGVRSLLQGLSYYYALPNRIFDFIQAGIPILATDFPEMARVVKEYQVGKTIAENRPEMIAKAIQEMLSQNYLKENFAKAASDFCWDNEQQKIKKQLCAYGLFE